MHIVCALPSWSVDHCGRPQCANSYPHYTSICFLSRFFCFTEHCWLQFVVHFLSPFEVTCFQPLDSGKLSLHSREMNFSLKKHIFLNNKSVCSVQVCLFCQFGMRPATSTLHSATEFRIQNSDSECMELGFLLSHWPVAWSHNLWNYTFDSRKAAKGLEPLSRSIWAATTVSSTKCFGRSDQTSNSK